MKKVYLVHERSIINNRCDNFCGIAYYSSLSKAKKDFDNRCNIYSVKDIEKEGEQLPTYNATVELGANYITHIQLVTYDVY